MNYGRVGLLIFTFLFFNGGSIEALEMPVLGRSTGGAVPDLGLSASKLSWSVIEREVADCILNEGLSKCIDSLTSDPEATDAAELLRRFEFYRRAGADDKLKVVIEELRNCDQDLDQDLLSNMAAVLIERQSWCSVDHFLRIFPQAAPENAHDLVLHQIESLSGKTSSHQERAELDKWFDQLSGLDQSKPSLIWLREYLQFLEEKQPESVDTVMTKLADIVRDNPDNFEYASVYVSVLSEFQPKEKEKQKQKQKLSWMVEKLNLPGVYQNYKFGELLTPVSAAEAVKFYRKALTMTLNAQDLKVMDKYLRSFASVYLPETVRERAEEELRLWARAGLARALKESGDVRGAYKELVSLSKVNKVGMPVYALTELAGQVQSSLGDRSERALEKQVLESERACGHSFSYWLSRANFFEGEGNREMVEKAYARAMALTDLGGSTRVIYSRVSVVSAYSKFLKRSRSGQAALAFLWKEFDASKNIRYRGRLLDLIFSYPEQVDPSYRPASDQRLFEYLESSSAWKKTEKVLVEKILKDASSSEVLMETIVSRLGKLAKGSNSESPADSRTASSIDFNKAIILGDAFIRFKRGKEAISLLEAVETAEENKHQSKEIDRLRFEACLSIDDWRRAKELWKDAAVDMAPLSLSSWAGRIALGAARSGDKNDSMSLWRFKDEIDKTDLSTLKALAHHGLKSELEEYYRLDSIKNSDLEPDYIKSARMILTLSQSN